MRKIYKLSDLFDLQMGKTPDRHNSEYWDNGIHPWISIADLSNNGKYVETTKELISESAVCETGIKPIFPGTVIMSFKLSVGKVAMVRTNPYIAYSNEAIMAFETRSDIPENEQPLNEYVYYLLSSLNFDNIGNKAVMGKTLNKAILQDLTVKIHPKEEQPKIIDVLTKCDALIDKRKKQLEKLDELVKARFVELFGDAEHNEKGLPTSPMTELCEIIDGDRGKNYPKQEEFSEEGFCLFLNAKNVTSNGFSFENCMYITEEKDKILRNGKLSRGDVVLTTRGTLGNLAFYDESVPYEHMRINSGMVILRMKRDRITERFFIEQFKMQLVSIKERIASGSAQPQLPISTMNKIVMLVPDVELQNQFAAFVKQTDKSKLEIQKSLEKLELLKKALMQKYFG